MVDREELQRVLAALREELRELEREAMRDLVLPVELLDGRAVIRRTKAFEATTGPPRGTPKNEMPRLGCDQAGQISSVSGSTAPTVDPVAIPDIAEICTLEISESAFVRPQRGRS
jgi:hypothetical protein